MAPEAYIEAQQRLDKAKREKEKAKFEAVRGIFEQTLNERFKDELTFDPILVKQDTPDEDGHEYVRVLIVFDGNQKLLDPDWTVGLISRVLPLMEEQGIEDFPLPQFVSKPEWGRFVRAQERKRNGNVGAW